MGQLRQALDSEYISVRRPMRGRRLYTNADSADPFRFLLGGECSPFSPYHWICTGELLVRTRHGQCRQKKGQRNRKESVERHVWARCRVDGGTTAQSLGLFIWLGTWSCYAFQHPAQPGGETAASTGRKSISDHRNKEDCGCKAMSVREHRALGRRGESGFIRKSKLLRESSLEIWVNN